MEKTDSATVDREQIVRGLRGAGITCGDVLLVHSSLKSFGRVRGGADAVIDALLEAVGPDGLVSVPTHTWGTVNARQPVFHETLSPSIVGHITNVFRLRPKAVRSLHPTHSVAAIGKRARRFIAGQERRVTPCSRKSPYRRLVEWGGKVVFLGVDLNVMTLMHAFEEWAHVPWLFSPRRQELCVIRRDGRIIKVPSRRHSEVPGLDRAFPSLEPLFRKKGILRSVRIGKAEVRILEAKPAAGLVVPLLRKDPDLVLKRRRRGGKAAGV
jgi:aminoglycoside 3-N-acetyltransferase